MHFPQDAEGRSLLVLVPLDAPQRRPREDPVESVHEGQAVSLAVEDPSLRAIPRRAERQCQEVPIPLAEPDVELVLRGRGVSLTGRDMMGDPFTCNCRLLVIGRRNNNRLLALSRPPRSQVHLRPR